jgi:ElaB/YqjD/DUF883 family membrane-anchored ribosome-binding protein
MSELIEAHQILRDDMKKRGDRLEAENHRLRDQNRQLLNLVLTSFGHRSEIYEAARKYVDATEDLSDRTV